jgi:hypothetical protein
MTDSQGLRLAQSGLEARYWQLADAGLSAGTATIHSKLQSGYPWVAKIDSATAGAVWLGFGIRYHK